ncbi:hypothetical protein LWF15_01210 [Kineosporia rhizophila]|uniref:hypothetical protein n=1 Tax=Kineosporia TaxID=49184 RepID=UPI001E4D7398|nr:MULTISPECIES: hypothetical protein [Kineosporia]MCE0534122.1 hypothetical protein [Kineosporia rhizophila]GLY13667.1 hypothetical protein Kisp01_06830 [Kineosporia sp. NBRC 101677]
MSADEVQRPGSSQNGLLGIALRILLMFLFLSLFGLASNGVRLPLVPGLVVLAAGVVLSLVAAVFVSNLVCDRYDRWRASR